MVTRVLCVAEKTSVARSVASHLSGGQFLTRNTRNRFIKNYDFQYNFGNRWSNCRVTMTAVSGHTEEFDFPDPYRSWGNCDLKDLFDAPIKKSVHDDKKIIADNIRQEARSAQILFIWTDCDREGEYIGTEIRNFARESNRNIQIARARFSNLERTHVIRAARNPVDIDENQANAVGARMEIDLRIGAVFTRFQTLKLQDTLGLTKEDGVISYGSCQFPTLGFVVDRFKRVQKFIPEPFWSLNLLDEREGIKVKFTWARNRMFDRLPVIILYEKCLEAKIGKISKVQKKPVHKWKPLPLTTIELQKQGSRCLGMSSQSIMKAAEELYTKGFISYPRTETDQFDKEFDFLSLVTRQVEDPGQWGWGQFANSLLQGGFSQPRNGKHNDKAHPPIHPVSYVTPGALQNREQKNVYEFVVRRFLACCSKDALGEATNVSLIIGSETFHTSGLRVLERNYLEIYRWDRWEDSQLLPEYQLGEELQPLEITLVESQTVSPHYITEPELLGLMEANGIGTDATTAEHIEKILVRKYIIEQHRRGTQVRSFCPSNLGVALVEAYDTIASDMSLGKPFLRKKMEIQMKDICEGRVTKEQVVQENLFQFRNVYVKLTRELESFRQVCRRYMNL